jgi:hypothetical protein
MELVEPYSLCVLSLEALAATKKHIGFATGVLIRCAKRTFIVTNYHVLAGRHPYTDCSLAPAIPEFIRVKYRVHERGAELPSVTEVDHSLYDAERNPVWFALPRNVRLLPVEPNGVKLAALKSRMPNSWGMFFTSNTATSIATYSRFDPSSLPDTPTSHLVFLAR